MQFSQLLVLHEGELLKQILHELALRDDDLSRVFNCDHDHVVSLLGVNYRDDDC